MTEATCATCDWFRPRPDDETGAGRCGVPRLDNPRPFETNAARRTHATCWCDQHKAAPAAVAPAPDALAETPEETVAELTQADRDRELAEMARKLVREWSGGLGGGADAARPAIDAMCALAAQIDNETRDAGDKADAAVHSHMLHALNEARTATRALIPQSEGDET